MNLPIPPCKFLGTADDCDCADFNMKAFIDAQLVKILNIKLDEIEQKAEDAILNGED